MFVILVMSVLILCVVTCSAGGSCTREGLNTVSNDELRNHFYIVICYEREFGELCKDYFGPNEARAACRQLGYVEGGIYQYRPVTTDSISALSFDCQGYEIQLTGAYGCRNLSINNCTSGQVGSVMCSNDYLSFLPLDIPMAQQMNVSISPSSDQGRVEFSFSSQVKIKDNFYSSVFIYKTGILSFGEDLLFNFTNPLNTSDGSTTIISPFFTTEFISSAVLVEGRFQTRSDNTGSQNDIIEVASRFVRVKIQNFFNAESFIIIQWTVQDGEHQFQYQAITLADSLRSYAIFTYKCNPNVHIPALIGVSVPNGRVDVFRYSSTPSTSLLACINQENDVDYYNLFYQLNEAVENDESTMSRFCAATAELSSGTCCSAFSDSTSSCTPNGVCYCDALCFKQNDCCADIANVSHLNSCLPLCEQGTVNQYGNDVYPVGPVSVCDNGFMQFVKHQQQGIENIEAATCLQINGVLSNNMTTLWEHTFPQLNLYPVSKKSLECTGFEESIKECEFIEVMETATSQDSLLSVNCTEFTAPQCTNGDIRLTHQELLEGTSESGGIIEICALSKWKKVCVFDFNTALARLLCQLIGILENNTVPKYDSTSLFEEEEGIRLLECASGVSSISQCIVRFDTCLGRPVRLLSCDGSDIVFSGPPPSSVQSPSLSLPHPYHLSKSHSGLSKLINSSVQYSTLSIDRSRQITTSANSYTNSNDSTVHPTSTTYIAPNSISQGVFSSSAIISDATEDFSSLSLTSVIGITFGITLTIVLVIGTTILSLVCCKQRNAKFCNKQLETINLESLNELVRSSEANEYVKTSSFNKDLLIPKYRLKISDCIGQGEFGIVYRAQLLENGLYKQVAVKTLKGGSLLNYLKQNRENLVIPGEPDNSVEEVEEVEVRLLSFCWQISKGMEYIAKLSLIHRDLAARNCMIDHEGNIKVGDFGLTKSLYDEIYYRENDMEGMKMPIKWMAIESIEDGVFSEKTDVWSFGVTCWEVFSGGIMPYGGIDSYSMRQYLQQGYRMERPNNKACGSNLYEEVIHACWFKSPNERPTFSDLASKIDVLLSSLAGYIDFNTLKLS